MERENIFICEETQILTNKGYKKLKDVSNKENIFNHNGKVSFIKNIKSCEKIRSLIKLEADGILNIYLSENIKIFIKRNIDSIGEWIRIKEVPLNSYMAIPKLKEINNIYNLKIEDCWSIGTFIANKERPSNHYRKIIEKFFHNEEGTFSKEILMLPTEHLLEVISGYINSKEDSHINSDSLGLSLAIIKIHNINIPIKLKNMFYDKEYLWMPIKNISRETKKNNISISIENIDNIILNNVLVCVK